MIWISLILACGGNPEKDTTPTGDTVEDTAESPAVDTGFCADAPVLSWENFGEGLLIEHCQACHATDAPFRETDNPPPEAVVFDTYEDAMAWKARILAVSTGDSPTMPPRGGLSDLDRERLELWLRCGEED